MSVYLNEATLEDIVAELRQRDFRFALYVNQMAQYKPEGDIPSDEREVVLSDGKGRPTDPIFSFVRGIQIELTEASLSLAVASEFSKVLKAWANLLAESEPD